MIVEKIFPINYYNELSGLMTDSSIIQKFLEDNFPEMYELLEVSGGIIYLSNAINKWFLTIFINRISEVYSNFIWDLFLLEGNIVIFKALYAIIIMLLKDIMKCTNFDQLNKVFQDYPLKLKNREKLAYYLLCKKFKFNMDKIKQHRKNTIIKIIKEIENLDYFDKDEIDNCKKKNDNNIPECDLDWPICIKDKKNLIKNYDHIIIKQLHEPEIIEDYIDNDKYTKVNKKEEKEEKFEDILIERKKHFCNSKIKSFRDNKLNNEIQNKEINIINENENKIDEKNNILKNGDIDENIKSKEMNQIVLNVAKDSKEINFQKENLEDSILSHDSSH